MHGQPGVLPPATTADSYSSPEENEKSTALELRWDSFSSKNTLEKNVRFSAELSNSSEEEREVECLTGIFTFPVRLLACKYSPSWQPQDLASKDPLRNPLQD